MNFKLALAGILIVGSAIGLALPLAFEGRFAGAEGVHLATTPQAKAVLALTTPADESGWNDSVTLRRERDGHFYADVNVDGLATRMLIDTGASVIALTGEDAIALGLNWDEADVAVVAQGANGPVYGVATVLPQVELGSFVATDVPALIVPEGLHVSLLGQSFLGKVRRVEIAGDELVMSS